MMDFTRYVATRLRRLVTPQSLPIPGSAQVPNSAGGYAWPLDRWDRLDRFLVLGSEGGTFYVGERELTVENARGAAECIAEDGPRTVHRVVEVSTSGRAPKNDPALFVLAMAAGLGDEETRRAALLALPRVARTGTHLFHWLRYAQAFRGGGRGVRRAVAEWYTAKPARELAYQLLKYPSRDGWSHRDALRLAHPRPETAEQGLLFRRVAKRATGEVPAELEGSETVGLLRAVDELHGGEPTPARAAALVREHRLTRENLGTMSAVGLLAPGSGAARTVAARLSDREALRRARVHPVAVLAALRTYGRGRGGRGAGPPVPQVVDALDAAFYLSFGAVRPSRRRTLLALDVSGSMDAPVLGMEGLSCREGAAAMALVTAAVEPEHRFTAFTTGLTPLSISPRQRLDDVVRSISGLPFGGTDCALPVREAAKGRWKVDTFVVYTDNETWAGSVHPAQALREYRERTGIPAKLVVVGMASNGFSIADPEDAGMLDVVGFDASAPQLISDFAR